ncbi:MAG: rhodanese-related sulfurtransferase [Nanoarchaeota archaeon]
MENVHILLYYKFLPIEDTNYFIRIHKRKCKELKIIGKVLIGKEGVNGSVAGSKEQMEEYKKFVHSLKGFEDVWFKEEIGKEAPFNKMIVRERKEIVSLHKNVDMAKKGKYVEPEKFLEDYNKDDVIILDTRNYYEYKLGRFKNAINPNIKTFREFPDFVEKFKENENKKIYIYCTGGIRCEKAARYMEDKGFKDVYQLHGGIINFCQKLPNTIWEGKCFVFDKRLMSDINQYNVITNCVTCNKISDLQRNCKNVNCDELVIQCNNCQEKMHGCCSKKCMNEFLKYARERAAKKKDGSWIVPKLVQEYRVKN